MERAVELWPHDAMTLFTLGWYREFVAHALERKRERHQPVAAMHRRSMRLPAPPFSVR